MGVAGLLLAGCGSTTVDSTDPGYVYDPLEKLNRGSHAINKTLDAAVLRPVAETYDAVTPPYGKYLVHNAVNTLKMPRVIANNALQGDLEGTLAGLMRLSMNVAFGAGGLLDPATEMGLPFEDNDFGLTLARYGLEEGAYLEIPFLGPSSVRGAVGQVVDIAFDPLTYVTGSTELAYGARVGAVIDARYQNAAAIDQALYESEDSYVTTRAAYLQYRRRQIAGETTEESLPSVFD